MTTKPKLPTRPPAPSASAPVFRTPDPGFRIPSSGVRICLALLLGTSPSVLWGAGPSPQALELRDRAIAALENEQPAEAEGPLRELVALTPKDPLAFANLTIVALRQQQATDAAASITKALALAPKRPDLLALRAEVELWNGEVDAAVASFLSAARAAKDDPETWYGVLRATQAAADVERVAGAADEALEALARLRPENAVVLLSRLRSTIEGGDRAAASATVLRLEELSWQLPEIGRKTLAEVRGALERGELAAARVPAIRLENVTKVLPMYQQSLRELNTGILGLPVLRFQDEPAVENFGDPVPIELVARALVPGEAGGVSAGALAWGFFDTDDLPDLARLAAGVVEIRLGATQWSIAGRVPVGQGAAGLLVADLDDDAVLDLVVFGKNLWFGRGDGEGGFADATAAWGLGRRSGQAAAVVDLDIEGDLDLAVAGGELEIYRNNLSGPLEPVGAAMSTSRGLEHPVDLIATDLDRDGDLDVVALDRQGISWFENLRQGQLRRNRIWTAAGGRSLLSADLDNDGQPELVIAGDQGLVILGRAAERAEMVLEQRTAVAGACRRAVAFDADNDGRLDLACAGARGVVLWGNRGGDFELGQVPVRGGEGSASDLVALDLDADGDLDLVAATAQGLVRFDNRGGNRNRWLAVRLHGIDRGSGKNNRFGLGATIEIKNGAAYQFREAAGQLTHFGLGNQPRAEVLRVEWTNGVPQNRLAVAGRQTVVEEQVLKGSCPFLYAWDGERMAFVSDLLWGAPIGLPFAPGKFIPADPSELIQIPALAERDGAFELRVTEELWEAAFIDHTRVWVVDHPAEVEVASALRMGVGPTPEVVLGSRGLRAFVEVRDHRGIDLTELAAARDERYAHAYEPSRYQGVAEREWSLELDLGESPDAPVRLHLDAWIFPADASLNLAVAQRGDLSTSPPRLEVEVGGSWQPVDVPFGFPAGKTKTMVVDLPDLPAGSQRLRITSGQWLGFDRIAWTTEPADAEPVVVAQLLPQAAELRFRGFSALRREAPNAPHSYDYDLVTSSSPWLPFPGRYTRYGEVTELLAAADSRSVVMAAGDEIALRFDAKGLPEVRPGWQRSYFFETWGWDKDADRNTFEAEQVEPLPFLEMEEYGDPLPESLREYEKRYLTREVGSHG